MRDLIVFLIFLWGLPYCFTRPFFGLLMFSWLGYMRPQDLCWGPARGQRFSLYVALAMFVGWVLFEHRPFTRHFPARKWLFLLGLWLTLSLWLNPIFHSSQIDKWIDILKVFAISLFTVGLVDSKARLDTLLYTIALSLGFFGIKGGLFGLVTGGRILQGPGGMLKDNNDLSLALNMAMPLLFYLGVMQKRRNLRLLLYAAVVLTAMAVVITKSRGGFLTLAAVLFLFVMKSRKKVVGLSMGAVALVLFLVFLPADVRERLATLKKPTEDGSASGRLHAWGVAWNMTKGNPTFGVGFMAFVYHFRAYDKTPEEEWEYGKSVGSVRVAHNSYMQLMAESGIPSMAFFLIMIFSTILSLRRLRAQVRSRDGPIWILYYTHMIEVSLVAFLIGATFLNRSHFDLLYHLVAVSACVSRIGMKSLKEETKEPVQNREAQFADQIGEPASVWGNDGGSARGEGDLVPAS